MSSSTSKKPKTKTPVWVWVVIIILIILVIVVPIIVWLLFKGDGGPSGGTGTVCTTSVDCATGLVCTSNVCSLPENSGGFGDDCTADIDCNDPLVCVDDNCTQSGTFGSDCVINANCNDPLTCVDETCQCPNLPPPQNINVTGAGLGSITLTWDAVVGAIGYTAYATNSGFTQMSPAGDETDDIVVDLPSGTLMHTFTGLGSLSWLNAAVRSVDDCGKSVLSDFDSEFDP